MIKQLEDNLVDAYQVIVQSFKAVADEHEMTEENCPGNSAFMSFDKFKMTIQSEFILFGLYKPQLVGCIGIEKKSAQRFKIKWLSVIPDHRHRGYGMRLMDHASTYIGEQGGEKIQLGMIYENQKLYHWYLSQGFVVDKIKAYKKNKFKIVFMEKRL